MANNIIVGIDVGTSTVGTVVLEVAEKKGTRRILGTGKAISQGIRRGYVSDFDDAVSSIKKSVREAERSSGVPIKRAYLGIGGIGIGAERSQGMVAVSRADREITDHDVKRVIEQSEANLSNLANKQILHTIPLVFSIDRDLKTTRPVGMKGGRLEAESLFITCLSQHVDDLVKSLETAGVGVEDIMASPLAASRAVFTKRQKEVGSLLADFGAGTVSLVVFDEGTPVSLEVFPLGSWHITRDISLGMQIPLEEAEALKISWGSESFSKRKLGEIVEARLGDIFDLIEAHLKKIGRSQLLPGGIVLTGGGANLANIADLSKSYLKLPAAVGVLRELENKESPTDPSWATALGLCFLAADEQKGSGIGVKVARKTKNIALRWLRSFLP